MRRAGTVVVEGQQAGRTRTVRELALVPRVVQASTLSWLLAPKEERASIEHLLVRPMEAQANTSRIAKEPVLGQASCSFVRVPMAAQETWAIAQAV